MPTVILAWPHIGHNSVNMSSGRSLWAELVGVYANAPWTMPEDIDMQVERPNANTYIVKFIIQKESSPRAFQFEAKAAGFTYLVQPTLVDANNNVPVFSLSQVGTDLYRIEWTGVVRHRQSGQIVNAAYPITVSIQSDVGSI